MIEESKYTTEDFVKAMEDDPCVGCMAGMCSDCCNSCSENKDMGGERI